MLKNIHILLEGLGLNLQKRALHIQFSNQVLNTQVFIQRIEGHHRINEGLQAELICLSTHANIALKQFIGCQVAVDQVTDRGELFRTTGLITTASQGQSDGSLTLYKLTLQDATSLWHKRRNSRVFMNKSVRDISEILFKEWQVRSSIFAARLSLDVSALSRDYDVRPFVMQSNETDYEFLTRLWRSEGMNWLIDEKEIIVSASAQTIQPQILSLIDNQQHFQALKRRSIRFHRSHATEPFDTITGLLAERSLNPTIVQTQRWQADQLAQSESQVLLSGHQHSEVQDNQSLNLEDLWTISPAWTSDLNGEDQTTSASSTQLDKLSQQLNQYHALQSKYFKANSRVRDAQVGYWFELHDHPELDQHPVNEREFLILGKHFYNQNNLPKDILMQLDQLMQSSRWKVLDDERQSNELFLIRRHIPVVPEYHPLQHRPMAHPQHAKVVGPEGESIYVDEWGRVKVRFLFTRNDDHQHDGGAGANDNDTDSAWVDVLTPWAGEGYGARFHPRIGEIVVIDFFEGDIDRPFIVGRIHEAERYQTMFDKKGQLPFTKKLSGIRSQEVDGEGFNQIRFDDTTGQISAQLQSSHGVSQLNLGNLSHPKEDEASDGRGEGFELRTDQWGALRAGAGLLLSTYKQENANANHLNTSPAKSQLESNLNHSKALSEIAKNQQTDPLEGLDHLKKFLDQIEQQDQSKAETFKQALMLLCAPNSIALSTNEDLYLSADQQINHSAADNINFSTQKSLIAHAQDKISLFAAQQGLKAVAAKGKVELQAQDDAIETIARHKVKIISTEDRIEIISPKEILLTAGGSQLKINGQGVFGITGGKFECKAGQHIFKEGQNIIEQKISLPKMETLFSNRINYQWNTACEREKEIFIVDKKEGTLIKSKKSLLNEVNQISTLRFYTSQKTDFIAFGFNSCQTYLRQELNKEDIDELLEDLEDEEIEDEVYTKEDTE
ncbi:type VI secretion system Vgr family protein [Acinetobacter sp. ASP199]|uniref:type VI secretion system Vgr family protein n=1 Tax=unclassified Acinetobacter TaxID=196816 RepID=UPI001F61BACC|nr:type VI secretion system Vgr family protein [Acinetobacter sp. ASP199]UNT59153.1 type VI secretion system tip protein VgrG [Acinetobacter sp. ASP199]